MKCPIMKCPIHEMSYPWNVLSMQCPIVLSMKWPNTLTFLKVPLFLYDSPHTPFGFLFPFGLHRSSLCFSHTPLWFFNIPLWFSSYSSFDSLHYLLCFSLHFPLILILPFGSLPIPFEFLEVPYDSSHISCCFLSNFPLIPYILLSYSLFMFIILSFDFYLTSLCFLSYFPLIRIIFPFDS